MIAAALSVFVLSAILSTFLLIGRTGLNASAYAEMNASLRSAVERFNHDARLAADLRWTDQRRLTFVPPAGLGPEITYAYEADPARMENPGRLLRIVGDGATEVLVENIAPDFAFARYRLPAPGTDEAQPATNDLETKQVEMRLRAFRSGPGTPTASQMAGSARCVLRNKSTAP